MGGEIIDNVTLTDADMNDPELLAELAALNGEPAPPKPQQNMAARRAQLEAQIVAKKKEAIRLKGDKKFSTPCCLRSVYCIACGVR